MKREDLAEYIMDTYDCQQDHPWERYPDYTVFRHTPSRKWFAVVMNVPRSRLGLCGDDVLDIVNVKCDPAEIEPLLQENGIYPAYHMNKRHWVSAALDGSVPDEGIRKLVAISFEATEKAGEKMTSIEAAEKHTEFFGGFPHYCYFVTD